MLLKDINRLGFNLPIKKEVKETKRQLVEEYQMWEYDSQKMDWLNAEHESTLTAYNPPHDLMTLLADHIDTDLE